MTVPDSVFDFLLPGCEVRECIPLAGGKVNDTWRVQDSAGERLILQRLPVTVFSDMRAVMRNIRITTDHLQRTLGHQASNRIRFFTLHSNPEGQSLYVDSQGNGWRIITYIEKSRTLEALNNPAQCREIGRTLGLFHTTMRSLDPALLTDPLPGLHDTLGYLEAYDRLNISGCISSDEKTCRDFITAMREIARLPFEQENGFSPIIIHGDPKASNFLFAQNDDRVISLIDLDTVKPGPLLHDLGDCLRSCCNQNGEDHANPEAADFDLQFFGAVMEGYVETGRAMLGAPERSALIDAIKLIGFELGLRFFTDHLRGNVYFKTDAPGENLKRALIQFNLVASIERKRPLLSTALENLLF